MHVCVSVDGGGWIESSNFQINQRHSTVKSFLRELKFEQRLSDDVFSFRRVWKSQWNIFVFHSRPTQPTIKKNIHCKCIEWIVIDVTFIRSSSNFFCFPFTRSTATKTNLSDGITVLISIRSIYNLRSVQSNSSNALIHTCPEQHGADTYNFNGIAPTNPKANGQWQRVQSKNKNICLPFLFAPHKCWWMCVWVSDSTFDMTAYIRFQNRKPIRRKFYSRGQGHHYQRDAQRPHNHTFVIFMCCTCDGWCSPLTQSNCAAHRASRNVDHRFHTRPRVNTTILYNRTLYVLLYMRCRYERRTYRMSNAQTTSTSSGNKKSNCRCTSELQFQFSLQ